MGSSSYTAHTYVNIGSEYVHCVAVDMHELELAGMLATLLWRRCVDFLPDVALRWAPKMLGTRCLDDDLATRQG